MTAVAELNKQRVSVFMEITCMCFENITTVPCLPAAVPLTTITKVIVDRSCIFLYIFPPSSTATTIQGLILVS